jgi:endonuclease YncB( thermonuclease family)
MPTSMLCIRLPLTCILPIAFAAHLLLGGQAGMPSADPIVGPAAIIDGGTIEIRGRRIRLFGIDVPETAQTCETFGSAYRCGQQAALALDALIGGQTLTCRPLAADRSHDTLARCSLRAVDIAGWMVERGWALADRGVSQDYVTAEEAARRKGLGLWETRGRGHE